MWEKARERVTILLRGAYDLRCRKEGDCFQVDVVLTKDLREAKVFFFVHDPDHEKWEGVYNRYS